MKGIIVILAMVSLGVSCLSEVAPLLAQPTLIINSNSDVAIGATYQAAQEGRLAYEPPKYCCECVQGIGPNRTYLGWMEIQRCYRTGGTCMGPFRLCP